jgi:single-strand DNA-binding protein
MSDLRMPSLNKVILAGRLTRDPELRYTPGGAAVCRLGLAVTRYFKGRDGEKKEDTLFVDVTAWEKTAEYCGQRLKQGRPVLIEGRLRSDAWEDKATGQKRTKIDIQAERIQELDWSDDRGGSPRPAPRPESDSRSMPMDEPPPEDDIPF